jgi:hypothetical protein
MLLKCGLMTLREKKGWAREDAKAQRNKGGPHKDAKAQRKNSLRLGGFARRKKNE